MHKRALPKASKNLGQVEIRRYGGQLWQSLAGTKELGPVLLGLVSVLGLNLTFVINNSGIFWLLPAGLPLMAALGACLFYVSGYLWRLQTRLVDSAGRLHAAFLLFFLFFLGFVVLYFILLALPLGVALDFFGDPALAVDYRRWSLDLAAGHALIFWAWTVFRRA